MGSFLVARETRGSSELEN